MASKNFGQSVVALAPSPAISGLSLTVSTGHGSRFSTGSLVLWPAGEPTPDNAEVVTVESISGDVLTLSARAVEGSVARAVTAGWQAAQGLTAGSWDTVAQQLAANTAAIANLTQLVGAGGSDDGIDGGTASSTYTSTGIDGGTA